MGRLILYLVRHASAGERGPQYPDDTLRPLDLKGHTQAKTLTNVFKTLDVTFDRLVSSPYTRAAQTAAALGPRLKKGRPIQHLDALASDDYSRLLLDLGAKLVPGDATVALVGHEPYLSELAAYLLTGTVEGVPLQVKKATCLTLVGTLAPGAMVLQTLLPATVYRRLQT